LGAASELDTPGRVEGGDGAEVIGADPDDLDIPHDASNVIITRSIAMGAAHLR
jgi:hypothetical protein